MNEQEKVYCPFLKAGQLAAGGKVTDDALCVPIDCALGAVGSEECVFQLIEYLLSEELDLPSADSVLKVHIVDDDTINRFGRCR